ncbi:flagellin [Alteribacillus persepolensis]|uniref:Flagellin n=1 Tax=Alteribacillus persepolensis TaxID=568899 RepID=A0A1G8K5Q1_9BACI|nr:flagellin [Alteribacillus persepolensis]SDI38816.1 flagellin [Alteribacillus persepolensis]
MKINNNIQALNAYRNLNHNQTQLSKNLEKLSSGLRINRASDDAAGLAISEKMRSQIRGLKQSERNSMDGISLIQTSEGAMQEIHSMLQRMRELAVQASNDSNTEYDREQLQKEMTELTKEINSISDKTEFNTKKLLDGSSAVYTELDEANETGLVKAPRPLDAAVEDGDYTITADAEDVIVGGEAVFDGEIEVESGKSLGTYSIEVEENQDDSKSVTIYDNSGKEIESTDVLDEKFTVAGFTFDDAGNLTEGKTDFRVEAEGTFTLTLEGEEIDKAPNVQTEEGKLELGDFEFAWDSNGLSVNETKKSSFEVINNALAFQIGPNTGQQVMVDIPQLDANELGVAAVDVSTHAGASEAMTALDHAINQVSSARAELGAVQNRLEHTIGNLQVTHENLTASESRIRDADMAEEMTAFTKNNIIHQSATAMLAQANQLPQGVLQLLQ